ncbi:hypothetical protein [Streptomyces sp. NPDC127039]|uniref:hypothetical protein n=1 Tax=Streptomyces sp. NPDC127039 TaxID=3347115 RepID=UPI003659F602
MGKALTKLEDAQTGLDKGSAFLAAAAQQGVFDSWTRRVKDITEWCDGLAGVLEKTGNDQLRTDEAIKAEIAALNAGLKATTAAQDNGLGGLEKIQEKLGKPSVPPMYHLGVGLEETVGPS